MITVTDSVNLRKTFREDAGIVSIGQRSRVAHIVVGRRKAALCGHYNEPVDVLQLPAEREICKLCLACTTSVTA